MRQQETRKGSVHNHNRRASGRPVSVRTGEKIEAARSSVVEDLNESYRQRAQDLLVQPSLILTLLKKDFKLTPYKMHNLQQLSLGDKAA